MNADTYASRATDSDGEFAGKVVLVTGGGSGIGRAAALAFARRGAAVVVCSRSDGGAETAKLIVASGGRSSFVKTDVTRSEQVDAAVRETIRQYGGLHCAFNNAGVLPDQVRLAEIDDSVFEDTIAVDLKSVFFCLKHEIRQMLRQGGGAIVNNASVGGLIAGHGMAPYVAAKHAVIGLTKAAAVDYAAQGIRVNAVAPGLVETPMTKRWLDNPDIRSAACKASPMARAAAPEEIAAFVVFLCSSAASFATGQTFVIDGGQSIV